MMALEKRGGFLPGFSDPVLGSQIAFRAILGAMSHPGRIFLLERGLEIPAPLHPAAGAVVLTLLDFETPLWMDLPPDSEAAEWFRFHCGCPLAEEPSAARFALITGDPSRTPMGRFFPGTDECPGDSATLIIQTKTLIEGRGRRLTGPGIQKENYLEIGGLAEDFWQGWKLNHSGYPLGVDVILTAGEVLVALPRTTLVE